MAARVLVSLSVVLLAQGCAMVGRNVGGEATEGAFTELQQQIEEVPPEQQGIIADRNSRAAVRAMLDELSKPVLQRQLASTIDLAMSQAARSLAQPSPPQGAGGPGTGGGGGGPPAEALGQQVARGIRDDLGDLLGPCGDVDPATCFDRRVTRLGKAAATGVLEGLRVPLLGVTFALGFLTCLLLVLAVGRRQRPL